MLSDFGAVSGMGCARDDEACLKDLRSLGLHVWSFGLRG